jgi:haloalkane dehalogenase
VDVLRTPDTRFASLPDFPSPARYVDVPDGDGGALRVAYVDVAPPDGGSGETVLLLHGEPSWSFLYRHVIPPLVAAGHRCVAPDLVGFGRSDKPARREDHSYARQVAWMRAALFDTLDLTGLTLVCQDWGGLVGLRLVGDAPDRFRRLVVANTGMPTGDQQMPEAFLAWQRFARETETFPVGSLVAGGCATELPAEVVAAYEAPFPDDRYAAGPRALPGLVPTTPDDPASADNRAAWEVLRRFDRPVLTAFSDGDPITRGGESVFHKLVPGAAGREHPTIRGAGHFLQEDRGPELAAVVADFVTETA